MKLATIIYDGKPSAAIVVENYAYLISELNSHLPNNVLDCLGDEFVMESLRKLDESIKNDPSKHNGYVFYQQEILSPILNPPSMRDGYAFRQHVSTARRNRGVEMIPEFDEYPIFYFTNHNAIFGSGELSLMPDHFQKLDFELEWCCVIGKKGRNIKAEEADSYIAGYTIMNDFSARTLQMEEMKLNLGPAKGKDFATCLGPFIVTPDELADYLIPAPDGHIGNQYNLEMKAFVNNVEVSKGNTGSMDWTFAEIIERASYGVDLYPGDVIGSGTVGTGCFLELNGTGLLNDKNYQVQWLEPNDSITLEITGLGKLTNQMKKENTDFSILSLKKNKP
jgi:fumarylacetoacetate (FAA) hydrolase